VSIRCGWLVGSPSVTENRLPPSSIEISRIDDDLRWILTTNIENRSIGAWKPPANGCRIESHASRVSNSDGESGRVRLKGRKLVCDSRLPSFFCSYQRSGESGFRWGENLH